MKLDVQLFGGRGASSNITGSRRYSKIAKEAAAVREIIGNRNLGTMTWKEVVAANTEFVKQKVDWTGIRDGYDKFNSKTWRTIDGGGMIKKSDYNKLIDKEQWKKAVKAQKEYEKAFKNSDLPF